MSLTLGILSIVIPFIGLILGIIGVVLSRIATKEIAKRNENGKGLAIFGLICNVIGIIIQAFAVFSIIAFYSLTIVS
ncbi:DUF4190 domain-containing protein [Lysinibacillus mangiferihumi]|uniref:DUF4190 domain-containing protein n=1 Tax=Lysinibacillus mangiferihumi TaxID=1130819 RepID=UPI002E1172E1